MKSKFPFAKLGLILIIAFTSLIFTSITSSAQTDTEPRTIHTACSGNCVADQIFLHSGMGDTMAKNAFHAWFDSYYTLTGCGDSAWKTDLAFLFDVFADAVGAPGGNTMQCWQGLAAQGSLCGDSCSDYFICDLKYAPNVRLSLESGTPGYADVTIDNQSNMDSLPELEPNAYSRRFHLRTTLQLDDGEALLVDDTEMPSLSFPNWITRGGYDDCVTAYGADEDRCKILEWLYVPSLYSISVQFNDGGLFDLTNQVENLSDANGSFSQNGYVRLLSNGDSLTIQQGPYAGIAWVKTHNLSADSHNQKVIPWDASQGDVTIVNHECNSWLSSCWITGDRTETDTYVFALRGPADKLLSGTYTVSLTADIAHEKDASDNTVSYSYDSTEVASQSENSDEVEATPTPAFRVADLPVIDLPGAGVYPYALNESTPAAMFRLPVPSDIRFMFIRLASLDGGQYNLFVKKGEIPVPGYPIINQDYDCMNYSDAAYAAGCPFTAPTADDYYIFVYGLNGGSYQLEIEWTTAAAQATQLARWTQTAQWATQQVTPVFFSEKENNDSLSSANNWNMQTPFTGQISKWSDHDAVRINIGEPGIYTFSITNTGPKLRAKLILYRAGSGNFLDDARAAGVGQNVSLTFDASAGEGYYLMVRPLAMGTGVESQPYTLSLTGFIPDPFESNDERASATNWNPLDEPIQGYFWDKTTGRADYYTFTAPQTLNDSPVTFTVTNPTSDLRVRMQLIAPSGVVIENSHYFAAGQPASLTKTLNANQVYTLKVDVLGVKTSILPYTLSATYIAGGVTPEPAETSQPVTLNIFAYRPGSYMPQPVSRAGVYAQVTGQPEILLGTTNVLGIFTTEIHLEPGQELTLRLERPGLDFEPHTWIFPGNISAHRVIFAANAPILIQATLTPTLPTTATQQPPLIQTALATPQLTSTPTLQATPQHTPTRVVQTQPVTISGFVWRLFPGMDPVGIGAARVIAAVNGVDQPAALSMIDGAYSITLPAVSSGDTLTLRAENSEDVFEPLTYQWLAEANVTQYAFDFYSYWGEITPSDQQSRVFGRVTDTTGRGMAGVRLLAQMGTSDAYIMLGPTNADGYYEAFLTLPARVMITVRVESAGYSPSSIQFFHSYTAVNRELNFSQISR